jgi:hypothetical protein
MVELVIALPLFVVMILFSIYLVELVRAKLKLQEATRFAAWELTSYPLDDVGEARHAHAFEVARAEVIQQTSARYADLDSTDDFLLDGPFLGLAAFSAELKQQDAPTSSVSLDLGRASGDLNTAVMGKLAGKTSAWAIEHSELNTAGWATASTSIQVANRILPRSYLQRTESGFYEVSPTGDRDLSALLLRQKLSLVVSDWHLTDGADATITRARAGRHRNQQTPEGNHGLFVQTARLVSMGDSGNRFGVLDQMRAWAPIPPILGTYVVAHNYGPAIETDPTSCKHIPSYPAGALHGLNNAWEWPTLDADSARCYDTAPFRDTQAYDESLYAGMFAARGSYFLGCVQAGADDPAASVDGSSGDEAPKIHCGEAQ